MADHATLGHFLPYLLRRRLQSVVWAPAGGERAVALLLLALMALYGAGFGFLLNTQSLHNKAALLPKLLVGLNATWLGSTLLIDFVPALRPVSRPLPEHFPVSERSNVLTAFLLDFITLRRLLVATALLVALALAPRHALVPGFSLLLVLGATVLSFNLRLLLALRRGWHPLLAAHLASLGLMLWWLAVPTAPYTRALGIAMALVPWGLWAAQLYWLGPYFSARYLPAGVTAAPGTGFSRLPLAWRVYLRKAAVPLGMGLFFKVLLLGVVSWQVSLQLKEQSYGLFYFSFLPLISFSYVNNNLFGYLRAMVANELLRRGLTPHLLRLYAQLVGPLVLAECLVAALLLLALFPASYWVQLWLLPLSVPPLASLGLWGSLYLAKPVAEQINFANARKNVSTLINILSIALAATLYFLPWWWARVLLAAVVTASAAWPLRQVWRNDGPLRRKLWRGIGA
jgi:hypothetical protein